MKITPVPVTYAGVRFRSTLEADWAATLDSLGIRWQYEPEAVRLPSGELYRPDFYLPRIATWLEVKGPHEEGLGKTRELAEAVFHFPGCPAPESLTSGDGERCCDGEYQLVVVGLAPVRGIATWYLLDQIGGEPWQDGTLQKCPACDAWWWCGLGAYGCRAHRRHEGGDDDLGEPGDDLPFVHAFRARAPK
jgi:hypothetical protein